MLISVRCGRASWVNPRRHMPRYAGALPTRMNRGAMLDTCVILAGAESAGRACNALPLPVPTAETLL